MSIQLTDHLFLDTKCENVQHITTDPVVERILSYQKVHGVVSNQDVSMMMTDINNIGQWRFL